MNGIALLTLFLATTAQVSSELGPNDIKYGWTLEKDRSISYIVQPTPQTLTKMAMGGNEITAPIPDFLQGVVKQVIFRVGSAEVEQIPSVEELRSMKQAFPPSNAMNQLNANTLSSLTDPRNTTVAIDPIRGNVPPIPISGATRISEGDPDASQPPLLAQNFSNNNSTRGSFGAPSNYELPRLGSPGPSGMSASNTTTLPRNDPYTFSNNGSFVGPTLPPTTPPSTPLSPSGFSSPTFSSSTSTPPYTGNAITVVGSPTTSTVGSTNGYAANQPMASGNFGNPNNYSYGNVPSLNYNNTSTYPPPNTTNYANGSYSNPAVGSASTYNYPQVASNTPVGGNYSYPNNTNTGNPNTMAPNTSNSTYNPMNPPFASPQAYGSNQYANPNTSNFPSMNPSVATSMAPNIASNPMAASTVARPQEFTTKSSYLDEAALRREYESTSSPNFLMALFLLASLVGNVYLFLLINQLLQRYRMLQASNRGSTTLAI